MNYDGNTNKPIVEQWRSKAITVPLVTIILSSILSIAMIAMTLAIWLEDPSQRSITVGSFMLVILLGVIWFFVIITLRYENPCKPSIRLVEASPDLEHKLNHAYKKAYETQTVEYGVATEYGLICHHGLAPWDAITRITFESREERGKNSSPCHMDVEVKLNEKTSYCLTEVFAQNRDVSEEIEQQIERIHKFDKSILIINNYVFIG